MKCLGFIGCLSGHELEIYLQTIRGETRKSLGPERMPRFLVHCVNPQYLQACFDRADWDRVTDELVENGRALANAGADCLVICGSALNPVAPEVRRRVGIPVIDLGYSIGLKLRRQHWRSVAILGIRTPEEETMWRGHLGDIILAQPRESERDWLGCCLRAAVAAEPIPVEWKIESNRIVSSLRRGGAQALILADPILGKWIRPGESLLYPIDAAEVHAWIATLWALDAAFLPVPGCVVYA